MQTNAKGLGPCECGCGRPRRKNQRTARDDCPGSIGYYELEFEDHGQDLIGLKIDAKTGVITDAGLLSTTFANGDFIVATDQLTKDRLVSFTDDGGRPGQFKYPMTKLTLNGEVLCDVALAGD